MGKQMTIVEKLANCILQSIDEANAEFLWDKFFRLWFRKHGQSYLFVFKRHLGVTNTQYVELFSLVDTHNNYRNEDPKFGSIIFETTENLKKSISESINTLLDENPDDRDMLASQFAELYIDIFRLTVAVDMFYCSCAVFLPPHMAIDIISICNESGYIHSAGKSVYVRNIKKARQHELETNLRIHFKSERYKTKPIPFIVYAHEDFSDHDKDAREQISRGIEHTKLFFEKMNMGSLRLAKVVENIKNTFADDIFVPDAGPFVIKHNFKKENTIWLICDRSISASNPVNPGRDRYYICYAQSIKNESPFFLFDENKPAWKSHTTMPHSLTSALINSTRPHVGRVSLCDPFGGTSTTWFEAKRIGVNASIRCSDISPITTLMARDNLKFFLATQGELLKIKNVFTAIKNKVVNKKRSTTLCCNTCCKIRLVAILIHT